MAPDPRPAGAPGARASVVPRPQPTARSPRRALHQPEHRRRARLQHPAQAGAKRRVDARFWPTHSCWPSVARRRAEGRARRASRRAACRGASGITRLTASRFCHGPTQACSAGSAPTMSGYERYQTPLPRPAAEHPAVRDADGHDLAAPDLEDAGRRAVADEVPGLPSAWTPRPRRSPCRARARLAPGRTPWRAYARLVLQAATTRPRSARRDRAESPDSCLGPP